MEKKFNKPELTIVLFNSEDIIVTSNYGNGFGQKGDFWGDPADPDEASN